jgi:hypothetical protein
MQLDRNSPLDNYPGQNPPEGVTRYRGEEVSSGYCVRRARCHLEIQRDSDHQLVGLAGSGLRREGSRGLTPT